MRRPLPDERPAITHRFEIDRMVGYLTVGLYDDGSPGELFVVMSKAGSTINGFVDAFALMCSYALQYGVPLQDLVDKLAHTRFEPAGRTRNPNIPEASSVVDYIARWLKWKFLPDPPSEPCEPIVRPEPVRTPSVETTFMNNDDAPPCLMCGAIMVRSGSCYSCLYCGNTSGCS